ncbi:hypothetical protein [Kocuria massiliensis]|uniref:hypothetical protein n=1 Tax=Kocuria massiliensis TaxID=1926282 RepID=UPI0022B99EC0|nr:hypothetical protein [Kocuria massiliensis]
MNKHTTDNGTPYILNRGGVARLLGVSRNTAKFYKLPDPDVVMVSETGTTWNLWWPETIIDWDNTRNPKRRWDTRVTGDDSQG